MANYSAQNGQLSESGCAAQQLCLLTCELVGADLKLANLSHMWDADQSAHVQPFGWQPICDCFCAATGMLKLFISGVWAVLNTDPQTHKQTDRCTYKQTHTQTDRCIDRKTDRRTDRHTDCLLFCLTEEETFMKEVHTSWTCNKWSATAASAMRTDGQTDV